MSRPNVLLIITDQQRYPPPYESDELRAYRREHLPGVERLRENGVSFRHHYPMTAACAPSRASLLTGQYPSLHGVTQTDGVAKSADGEDMFWLAPDTVPTLGDWFRAGGYRTFFKGKWHASHAHLDAEDGEGFLLSIDDEGTPIEENIQKYLDADLLDEYGFSEWVGPEPHELGKHNTGTVKDPFTADETIERRGPRLPPPCRLTPRPGAEGALFAHGSRFGGHAPCLKDHRLHSAASNRRSLPARTCRSASISITGDYPELNPYEFTAARSTV